MILTPTNTGSVVAGTGVGVFTWSAFLKADKIPVLRKFITKNRKEKTLSWMNKNKGITLLGLETVNFSIHGITDANAVLFALGNTLLNGVMLFCWLPCANGNMTGCTLKLC